MTAFRFSLPHRLLTRYGVLLFFLLGLPLATWLSFQLLLALGNYYGLALLPAPYAGPLTP